MAPFTWHLRPAGCATHGTASRRGVGLAEMLVALVLTGVLAGAVAGVLRHGLRLAEAQRQQMARAEAVRTVAFVLGGELRHLVTNDLPVVEAESVALRAMRGLAIVCGGSAAAPLALVRGLRLPDPDKDSVLVVGAANSPVRAILEADRSDDCAAEGGESVLRLRLDGPLPGRALLYFERGSYHMSGRALRYRRGRAGRQPLTETLLDDAFFHLHQGPPLDAPLAISAIQRLTEVAGHDSVLVHVSFSNGAPALDPREPP